ncbi:hypothetical protein HHK36_006518 [Tetracentron sinense]|uniref:SPX domain-containing protein n=1 Tax=Tetracentron sinense TaxID=13715 RepID=A0A835DP84_TETSI|nr:hypothetical protein HHK36_006518 [Tetracentron sinense]
MKFGKEFQIHLEETLPEWRDKFLCYKVLKKLLKHISATQIDHREFQIDASSPLILLQDWFIQILNEELDKFNDFYVDKEEEFIIRLQISYPPIALSIELQLATGVFSVSVEELKERIERVKEKSSKAGVFTSESEFSEEMLDIRKDFVTIHGEMVLLENYSSLNFAGATAPSYFSSSISNQGLVKILKKYDKRTGGLLRLPFTQRALHQPFFTTEPLTRLVRECEANLEVLFPSEAEVIESTHLSQDQADPPCNDSTDTPLEASTSLGEDTVDIYRSTLAAMKTIQGLRKESSTYSPLSFGSLFRSQGDDSTGAITAENSAENSSATLQNGEETDQEDG